MTQPTAKARNEGQWALGNTDPLNANEEFKKVENSLSCILRHRNVLGGFGVFNRCDAGTLTEDVDVEQ